jgi:hypothetical protein
MVFYILYVNLLLPREASHVLASLSSLLPLFSFAALSSLSLTSDEDEELTHHPTKRKRVTNKRKRIDESHSRRLQLRR